MPIMTTRFRSPTRATINWHEQENGGLLVCSSVPYSYYAGIVPYFPVLQSKHGGGVTCEPVSPSRGLLGRARGSWTVSCGSGLG